MSNDHEPLQRAIVDTYRGRLPELGAVWDRLMALHGQLIEQWARYDLERADHRARCGDECGSDCALMIAEYDEVCREYVSRAMTVRAKQEEIIAEMRERASYGRR
ncbi:hypothetical protein FHR83_007139 [Actinoplanes campanulatus]|uniref:Uncharacterized protein n=1 Tax=Actinoplanes campanulatus TaxID=113559 RepID=A0A7W5ANE4_9ACTN|nr:hypothetical protein [Actinoplanes campanulatus]MBB3099433.1 hypothetical protein [Actinoplanes campanulatus]GGN40009.1 hypothetical protein GCM10010109_68520 [Actinoplanes campanulatus]GID42357.1 hypothetical protein Aca09nite_88630 [Actinoplanes campanulatus]